MRPCHNYLYLWVEVLANFRLHPLENCSSNIDYKVGKVRLLPISSKYSPNNFAGHMLIGYEEIQWIPWLMQAENCKNGGISVNSREIDSVSAKKWRNLGKKPKAWLIFSRKCSVVSRDDFKNPPYIYMYKKWANLSDI